LTYANSPVSVITQMTSEKHFIQVTCHV